MFRKSKGFPVSHRLSALFGLSVLLLSACGNPGVGVILWPPSDSDWKVGQLVKVRDRSHIRNTYVVDLPGQTRLKDEIDQWRLRIFRKRAEAKVYASTLTAWADIYAKCLYQGLPMREKPSNLSELVYRFRQDDLIKIINREDGPVKVGNLQGYWYRGLSEGGTEGYIFDYYLNIVRIKDGKHSIIDKNNF